MHSGRTESAPYQLFMLVLSLVTLGTLAIDVIADLSPATRTLLRYADVVVCFIFLADFFHCLRRSANRWRYLYTWGWLDLASSIPVIDAARWGRAARAIRIVRLMRGVRATRILGTLVLARRAESTVLAASLVAILLLVASSVSILQFENVPEANIKTPDDAIWWALTTITTVGYGDRYPVTAEGRFVAGLLMCAGVGLFGMFSGLLAAWFVAPAANQENAEIAALRQEIQQLRNLLEARVREGL